MTATIAATCAELYRCNPTFAAGVNKWVADQRCPVQLGDYLEELGFTAAADCARWAATEPDRYTFVTKHAKSGPFPWPDHGPSRDWYWFYSDGLRDSNCVPEKRAPLMRRDSFHASPHFESPRDAILWLLDNWVPE